MFDKILSSTASRICVIAAPGSGKTSRILVPKADQLLANPAIDPRQVLLLTFSRLSAKDLKEKVTKLDRAPRASTVHSMCLAFLLSENNHDIRRRVDSIVLDFEKDVLVSDLKALLPHRGKRELKKSLLLFSAGWATDPHDKVFETTESDRQFKAAVLNWLSEHEAALMEEVVCGAVDLATQLGVAPFIQEPQYILVDEYQDLNQLEQTFIEHLARESKLLLIVGDPDQSIYSFKFSHPQGIRDFAKGKGVDSYLSVETGRCPRKIVALANQLLQQGEPGRTTMLKPLRTDDGEVHFLQKMTQAEEFDGVLSSISARLKASANGKDIFILVPRRGLGTDFEKWANDKAQGAGVPNEVRFKFTSKPTFTPVEQERILLLGLAVKPSSFLHARSYLGLGDKQWRATDLKIAKSRYGDLAKVITAGTPTDFPATQIRLRRLCQRAVDLRTAVASLAAKGALDEVLNELLPIGNPETESLRRLLDSLREPDDSLVSLYAKFLDYLRDVPTNEADIRIMTLMGSKGLEAKHVYIIGCNASNLPGSNRSAHLSEHDHKAEQRRLLFVGVTRATQSLTLSWSRRIPFSQSMRHQTPGIRVRRSQSSIYAEVGLSEFLQDLTGVVWE